MTAVDARPHVTPPTLRVLHVLKVKGFAEPPALAEATGLTEAAVADIVTALAVAGHALWYRIARYPDDIADYLEEQRRRRYINPPRRRRH